MIMEIIVPLGLFRAALASVKPHAATDKKDERGRSIVITATGAQVLVTASSGLTSALALVPLEEQDLTGELSRFTFSPEACKNVIDFFSLDKNDPDQQLEITVRTTEEKKPGEQKPMKVATVTLRRLGQLFGGDQLRLTEPIQERDVQGLWGTISRAARRAEETIRPVNIPADRFNLFRSAQTVYNRAIAVTSDGPATGGLLVYCGEFFTGWMAVDRVDHDDASTRAHQRRQQFWASALPVNMIHAV